MLKKSTLTIDKCFIPTYNCFRINKEVIAKMKNKIIELSVMAVFFIVISRKFDDIDKKLMQIKESYNITGKKLTY
jgi:hypothetical protein